MKRIHLATLLMTFAVLLGLSSRVHAQPLIYGASPSLDSMWSIDTTTWQVVHRMAPSLSGFTITGITGMAFDPVEHEFYCILKVNGVTGRVLSKINLQTGVCTQMGNLGNNFSTLAFRADGQLFGVTGDGAVTNPETLFLIDKTNGTTTLATALGNGDDGEIITYNHDDGFFYHWSGNTIVVCEKIQSVAPYAVTPISVDSTSGETMGSIYMGNGLFLQSTIDSDFRWVDIGGIQQPSFSSTPAYYRGIVMVPKFVIPQDTICQRTELLEVVHESGVLQDTLVINWGDGTTTHTYPVASTGHIYTSTGNKTVRVILKNPYATPDTMLVKTINVKNTPTVGVSPAGPHILCDGATITLTGTNGGTSQWYRNGQPITSATTPSYTASTSGIFNMLKTNLNGCADSAATGVQVMAGTTPSPFTLPDDTICTGDSTCIGVASTPGLLYSWSNGNTNSIQCFNATGTFTLSVSDSAGCSTMATTNVAVYSVPQPSITFDTTACPDITIIINDLSPANYTLETGDGSTLGFTTSSILHTYASNGSYNLTLFAVNQCGADTVTAQLVLGCVMALDNSIHGRVDVSPNPTRDQLNISVQLDLAGEMDFALTDLSGKVVRSAATGLASSHLMVMDIADLPAGVYILTAATADGAAHFKIIKE